MYPVLTPSDIEIIADSFKLGPVTVQRHTNKVFRFDTHSETYALRFYNAGVSQTHVQAIHTTCQSLAEADLPVVKPLATIVGTTIVKYQSWLGELQPWIVHDDDGGQWNTLVKAAATLRQLHEYMSDITVRTDQQEDTWRTPTELAEQFAIDGAVLREQAKLAHMDIQQHLDQATIILEILQKDGRLDNLPRQLTHGDFQGPNLLYQDGFLVGIIDFERLEYRPRLYDLAWPFVFWRWFGTDADKYTEMDWYYARTFCDLYRSARATKIDDDEWATLPLLMAYIPIRGIVLAAKEAEPLAEIRAFAKALDFAEWLVRNPEQAISRLHTH